MKKRISANRMELMRLKKELLMARRGHKMLKDKRDELMRQFLEKVKENVKVRKMVNEKLFQAKEGLLLASAVMESEVLQGALLLSSKEQSVRVDFQKYMGVLVPKFFKEENFFEKKGVPYSLSQTSEDLDLSVRLLTETVQPLLLLAEVEKTVQLLADEIEKTRRRVNSLEYVRIPSLQASIRAITLRMEENERGNLTRLMKVKEMILERSHGKKAHLYDGTME